MGSITSRSIVGMVVAAAASAGSTTALAQTTGPAAASASPSGRSRLAGIKFTSPRPSASVRAPQAKAVEHLEAARVTLRARGDVAGEAEALNELGAVHVRLGDTQKALAAYEEALRIARGEVATPQPGRTVPPPAERGRTAPDQPPTVRRGTPIPPRDAPRAGPGAVHPDASTSPPPARPARERHAEAIALASLGRIHAGQGGREKAVENLDAALAIHVDLGDREGQAGVLGIVAAVRQDQGENGKALDLYRGEIPLRRALGDRSGEAAALKDMAGVYRAVGQNDKALAALHESIKVAHESNSTAAEARALTDLAALHAAASKNPGEKRRGLAELDRAIALSQQARDPEAKAAALQERGAIQRSLGKRKQAMQSLRNALALRRATGHAAGEAETLSGLSGLMARTSPGFATFLAKKAVKTYAATLVERHGLDRELRRSFPAVVSAHRLPADLLVSRGRLAEARQLLVSLRELEAERVVGGEAPSPRSIDLSPAETEAEAKYEEALQPITELGAELQELYENPPPNPPPPEDPDAMKKWQDRIDVLEEALEKAQAEFDDFLKKLAVEIKSQRASDLRDDAALKTTLGDLGPGVVAIYTFIGETKVWAMLVTSSMDKGYELDKLKPSELHRMVVALRTAIDRLEDPRPQAKELYDALLAPMENELAGAKAKTIMWWLDGALRYVPLGALWDGRQWLVERYQNVVFTLASEARLKDEPKRSWNVLGLGVTREHAPLIALPGVKAELDAVVREENSREPGVLAGHRLLDDQFTELNMMTGLARNHPAVVHFASHYVFRPVRSSTEEIEPDPSFLLLGDGTHLTLRDLDLRQSVFNGVDLVALSACDTAMGGDDTEETIPGAEFDGLARVAQQKGAKAVLATLWSVADVSTPALMREFYRRREQDGGRTKAAALQEAQRAMLNGALAPGRDEGPAGERGGTVKRAPPKFPGWQHPYYWAPFILLGNWK